MYSANMYGGAPVARRFRTLFWQRNTHLVTQAPVFVVSEFCQLRTFDAHAEACCRQITHCVRAGNENPHVVCSPTNFFWSRIGKCQLRVLLCCSWFLFHYYCYCCCHHYSAEEYCFSVRGLFQHYCYCCCHNDCCCCCHHHYA